jgi:hypothetical protein
VYLAHGLLDLRGHELIYLPNLGKDAERLSAYARAKTLRFFISCGRESWSGRRREDATAPRSTQQQSRLPITLTSAHRGHLEEADGYVNSNDSGFRFQISAAGRR